MQYKRGLNNYLEVEVRHARLEANSIDVRTEGSRVILKGEVDSWTEADEAEFAAWQAPGVTEVKNDLRIVP